MQKFLVMFGAVLMAALVAAVPALSDNVVDVGEGLNIVAISATAATVFAAPNIPGARYTKTILAVIGALVVLPVSYFTDGFTPAEGVQIAIAVLAAIGVRQFKNTGDTLAKSPPDLNY